MARIYQINGVVVSKEEYIAYSAKEAGEEAGRAATLWADPEITPDNPNYQSIYNNAYQKASKAYLSKAAATDAASATTTPSKSDAASAAKITNPAIVGAPNNAVKGNFVYSETGGGAFVGYRNPKRKKPEIPVTDTGDETDRLAARYPANVPPGAERPAPEPVQEVSIQSMDGVTSKAYDGRVKIRVPQDYLTFLTSGSTTGKELAKLGGVIFPYTPQISYEHKATYSTQNPTHSNYGIHFYKNSSVEDITIQGKFTVQNDRDAEIYISTITLLKALTKMRFGNNTSEVGAGRGVSQVKTIDFDSGAPPPVCRLDAYGSFMFKNVPVVITSFKNDWPEGVDYYTLDKKDNTGAPYGPTTVPTLSTIQLTLKVVYSRKEMLGTSVSGFLNDPQLRARGIL
jgi:hypothetical protein